MCNLSISIKDNGMGIDKVTLANIRERLSMNNGYMGSEENDYSSIGLFNVHNRLRLIYGSEYGIEIDSDLGKGTEVILKIPVGGDNHV